jgi:RNA polymerase-binding transcription factor DksA
MAKTTKAPAKKAASKNASARKAATKKSATGRPAKKAAKKSAPKKVAAKKSAVKKSVPKKVAAKKTAPKKSAPKKTAQKKTAPKKPAVKAPTKAPAKKAAAKKPAPKKPAKSPYDKKFLDAQQEALLEERARLTKDVEGLEAEANELAMLREPGDVQFDEESGEGDTLAVERERDLALSAQFRAHIEDIDHALEKIRLNTYGLCEISGLAIPKERLRAIPWARERVEYKVGGFGRR